MPPKDEKVLKAKPSLLSIDTGMVIWTDVDLSELGGEAGVRVGGGGGDSGGDSSGPRLAPPQRIFYALCNRTDHDAFPLAFGVVQPNGIWIGPSHLTWEGAGSDVANHAAEAVHGGENTIVVTEIGSALAGPVTQP